MLNNLKIFVTHKKRTLIKRWFLTHKTIAEQSRFVRLEYSLSPWAKRYSQLQQVKKHVDDNERNRCKIRMHIKITILTLMYTKTNMCILMSLRVIIHPIDSPESRKWNASRRFFYDFIPYPVRPDIQIQYDLQLLYA